MNLGFILVTECGEVSKSKNHLTLTTGKKLLSVQATLHDKISYDILPHG
jgi:hypothetical protein